MEVSTNLNHRGILKLELLLRLDQLVYISKLNQFVGRMLKQPCLIISVFPLSSCKIGPIGGGGGATIWVKNISKNIKCSKTVHMGFGTDKTVRKKISLGHVFCYFGHNLF